MVQIINNRGVQLMESPSYNVKEAGTSEGLYMETAGVQTWQIAVGLIHQNIVILACALSQLVSKAENRCLRRGMVQTHELVGAG